MTRTSCSAATCRRRAAGGRFLHDDRIQSRVTRRRKQCLHEGHSMLARVNSSHAPRWQARTMNGTRVRAPALTLMQGYRTCVYVRAMSSHAYENAWTVEFNSFPRFQLRNESHQREPLLHWIGARALNSRNARGFSQQNLQEIKRNESSNGKQQCVLHRLHCRSSLRFFIKTIDHRLSILMFVRKETGKI